MKTEQSIDQIIDLEYFLHEDALLAPDTLHSRDRTIALELTAEGDDEDTSHSAMISAWVKARRKTAFSGNTIDSPGIIFSTSRSFATTLISIKGLITGLITGFAFFAYAGKTPINVLEFLIFFILSQLVLVAMLLCGLLLRKIFPTIQLPSGGFSLLYGLGKKLFGSIHKKWFTTLDGKKRNSVRYAFGIVRRNHTLYGSLFYWPLFSLAQLFGITFNAGLLASSILKIVTSDLAFGWQSTLQLSSTAIEKLVQLLASPWRWFLPEGVGTPTLEQIEGSRIILKDGIYHLSTIDLVAWWPFLILCLVVYGLILRSCFYIVGTTVERHLLGRIEFSSPQCLALLRRMRSPVVTTQATPETEASTKAASAYTPSVSLQGAALEVPQILLIPDEIYECFSPSYLQNILKEKGFAIKEQHRFMVGYEEDKELLITLGGRSPESYEGICIIMESWMVPLVDFISFLTELRKLSQPQTPIEVVLTGRIEDNCFSEVMKPDMDIWQKKIVSIGDPYIQVTPIAGIHQ